MRHEKNNEGCVSKTVATNEKGDREKSVLERTLLRATAATSRFSQRGERGATTTTTTDDVLFFVGPQRGENKNPKKKFIKIIKTGRFSMFRSPKSWPWSPQSKSGKVGK